MSIKRVLAAVAAGIAAVSATTVPSGALQGNPIFTPGLQQQVPVGQPFTITWNPTTAGTVSLILLRGPSTNVVPLATIVEGIANTGSYVWTPSTSLENDVTHYGLELIVDATGDYQYSTQFGISNPNGASSAISSILASATAVGSSAVSSLAVSSTIVPTTSAIQVVSTECANSTLITKVTATSAIVASTGYPVANSSAIQPSKPMTIPSSLVAGSTATGTAPSVPQSTGAAGHVKAAIGLVGAVAGLVMVL